MKKTVALICSLLYLMIGASLALAQNPVEKITRVDSFQQSDSTYSEGIECKKYLEYWFSEYDKMDLLEKGLVNPEKELFESLVEEKELSKEIQQDAILGGTVRFDPNPFFISRNFVVVAASDGHIEVYYLFRYDIDKAGNIKWKLLSRFG